MWILSRKKARRAGLIFAVGFVVLSALVLLFVRGLGGYRMAVNLTDSVDGLLFVVNENDRSVARNKLIAFYPPKTKFYANDPQFIKYVWAIEGDEVVISDKRQVIINGEVRGTAKRTSKQGDVMQLSDSKTVERGEFFVGTTHPDSLDSRYKIISYIGEDRLIGSATKIF